MRSELYTVRGQRAHRATLLHVCLRGEMRIRSQLDGHGVEKRRYLVNERNQFRRSSAVNRGRRHTGLSVFASGELRSDQSSGDARHLIRWLRVGGSTRAYSIGHRVLHALNGWLYAAAGPTP